MQLKTVGESLTALNSINGLINRLNNNTITYNQALCGLTGVGDAYSLSALKMAISQTKLNEEQIRAILVSNGLQGELLETTTAELAQITTNNAMTVSENAATAATARFSYAVKGLGASFKAFLVAHPVLTAIAAIGVTIYAATKIIDACTISFDELKEEISELKQEISDSESEIEDISSQLKDVNQKIKDIQSLGTLTFTEEGELENLQKQKIELENLYNIEKARHELAQEKLENAAQEYLSKTSVSKYKTESYTQKKVQNGQFVDVSYTKAAQTTQLEEMKAAASEMLKQQKIIDQLNSDYNNLDKPSDKENKEYKKNLEKAEKARDEAKETALNIQKEAQEQVQGLDKSSKSYQQVFEASQYLSDQIAFMNNDIKSLSSEGKKSYFKQNVSFDNKETKQEFNKFVDGLSDEELELLIDVSIDEDSTIDEIKDSLRKVVDIAQKQIAKSSKPIKFTDIFSLKTESGEATVLSNLKDSINEITSAYQSLSEATEEYRTTGSLSFSTIEKLIESGDDWLNYLTIEDGQLRINEQAYYDMAQAKLYELKVQALQNLSEQAKGLKNVGEAQSLIESQNYATADSYKTLASSIITETTAELEAKKAQAETNDEKAKWQEYIDWYKQQAENISKTIDSVDMHGMLSGGESALSDTLSKAQKTADLINAVKEEIEDNGKISVSTLQDIACAYPVLEKYVQDYMAGVESSEANLIAQLDQMYKQDVNDYKSAWQLKARYDRSFWVDFQNGSADIVNRLKDQYGVDIKNFGSYAQAKIAINEKIKASLEAVLKADRYVMEQTTGDITKSAAVAGLNTDQKMYADKQWVKWKDEYLNAKLNGQEYLITADQMAQNLERAGGLNPSSAKDLAKTLYTNLMKLGVESGRGYKEGLQIELDGLDTPFETYTADYADKISLAFDDPIKLDSSKTDKDTKETFDWIEIRIQRLNELLDKLKTRADNTYASWTSRNTALAQAIGKTYEAINLQSQAYSRYMQEADSVGLSGYYKTLVQNGAIDISTISDETLKDQINEYQNWYEKAQDCLKTQEDLNAELNEFKTQKFNHLKSEYDAIRERTEAQKELIESQITLLSTANDYNSIRNKQSSVISQLQKERSVLADTLNNSGIQMYTEEWYNLTSQVEDFDQQIVDAKKELLEINNLQFDNLKKVFEYNIDTLESAYNLMENEISLLSKRTDYNNLRLAKQTELQMLDSELSSLTAAFNSFHVQAGTEQWYEMNSEITSIREKIQDTQKSLMEIDTLQFDNLKEAFDFDVSRIKYVLEMLQNETDLLEMKGLFVNQSYYDGMKEVTLKELETLKKEREQLAAMLQNTTYTKGTSEWNDMFSTLMEIDKEISSLTNDMEEFDITIRNLNWEVFEYLEESINRITDETEYLVNLLSNTTLFEKENGNMTENAIATLGLHATAYEVYKQQAQDYYEEVQDLQRQLVVGAGKDVLEQYHEMVKAHQDSILAANDERQAIPDLIEEGYKAQLAALQKLIDKKKEQMQAEKSLYDYQKSIQEKTDNIASLEKQKTAYADDDSEEAMSRIQKIKVQLEEAKADLKETEYERYLSDTETMLDQLASDYETWMNERLDNEDALLAEILGAVDTQSSNIMETLNNLAVQYGTMISDNIYNVFRTEGATSFAASLTTAIGNVGTDGIAAIYSSVNAVNSLLAENSAITNGYISSAGDGINGNLGTVNAGIGNLNGTLGLTNQHLADLYNNVGGLGNTLNGVGNNITGSINGLGNSLTSAVSGTQNAISSLLSQLIQTSSASKVTVSTPIASYSHTPASTTSSASTSPAQSNTSSGSSIFIHKADSYPKNRLQIETSVVDRLKKFDFDSSFTARSSYYSKLGGTGTYTGSSLQNTWLIRKMKEMGYQKGTSHAKEGWHWTQENGGEIVVRKSDGAMLLPLQDGDMVFNNESTRRLYELSQNPEEYFRKYNVSPDAIKATPVFEFKMPEMDSSAGSTYNNTNTNQQTNMGDVQVNINLPNVSDYRSFRNELIKDSTFEKALFASVNHALTGKGTALDKLKYAR